MALRRIIFWVFFSPFLAFAGLNFEKWIATKGWDNVLLDAEEIAREVDVPFSFEQVYQSVEAFFLSDFAFGFVIGSALFAFWEPVAMVAEKLKRVTAGDRKVSAQFNTSATDRPDPGGEHLVLDDSLIWVKQSGDIIEISAKLSYRNRSAKSMHLKGYAAEFIVRGMATDGPSVTGGMSAPLNADTVGSVVFRTVRLYECHRGDAGHLKFGLIFWRDGDEKRRVMHVDWPFQFGDIEVGDSRYPVKVVGEPKVAYRDAEADQ